MVPRPGRRRRGRGGPLCCSSVQGPLNNNNHNKRPLIPKSMPPTGDEHAKALSGTDNYICNWFVCGFPLFVIAALHFFVTHLGLQFALRSDNCLKCHLIYLINMIYRIFN